MTRLLFSLFCLLSMVHLFGQDNFSHFNPEYFHKQQFAHRGGYASGAENTLKTVVFNVRNGVTALEVDVTRTLDNELILFHDDTIRGLLQTERDANVWDLTLEELKEIPLRDTTDGLQYICTLTELVDTLGVMIPDLETDGFLLELDFKAHTDPKEGVKALIDVIQPEVAKFGEGLYDYFFVSSFYPGVLKELKKQDANINKAYAINDSPPYKKFKAKVGVWLAPYFMWRSKARIIEPNLCMVDAKFVNKWKGKGKLINSYTANTDCQKNHLTELKVAFTTDCPGTFCKQDPNDIYYVPTRWCEDCD